MMAACFIGSTTQSRAAIIRTNYEALVEYTNVVAGTTNGDSLTINGTAYLYTNGIPADPAAWILSTNDVGHASTNTLLFLNTYKPPGVWFSANESTNKVRIHSQVFSNLTVTLSAGLGVVTYKTNLPASMRPVLVPPQSLPYPPGATNTISLLIEALGSGYPTSKLSSTAVAFSNYVALFTAQTLSNKTLWASAFNGDVITNTEFQGGSISNAQLVIARLTDASDAIWLESSLPETNKIVLSEETQPQLVDWDGNWVTNTSPALGDLLNYTSMRALFPSFLSTFLNYWGSTNLFTNNQASISFYNGFLSTNASLATPSLIGGINTGSAFESYSNGVATGFQAGQGAHAAGASSTAIGTTAYAEDSSDTALGSVAQATGEFSAALGPYTTASALSATAVGRLASASGEGSVALGFNSVATNDYSIMLGSNHVVHVPGVLAPTVTTNQTLVGTNQINGAIGFAKRSESTLASGNNNITNAFNDAWVDLTAPGAATTIDGITDGWAGRRIIYTKRNGGYDMVIANESGLAPAGMRILTGTGGDITVTNSPGFFEVMYDGGASRWLLIGHSD